MSYVITRPCLGTMDRSCVEVCPVDCFYKITDKKYNEKFAVGPTKEGEYGMLMIHPDQCINCGACETECPVEAIFEDTGVPTPDKEFCAIAEQELGSLDDDTLDKIRCTSK